MKPSSGYQALRRGRYSQVNARYVITICTLNRISILCEESNPIHLFGLMKNCQDGYDLVASVIMPDHIHLVLALSSVSLTRAIQRFKSRASIEVNRILNRSGPLWQPGFFDHKFRSDEDLAPILIYMWKNPETPGLHFRCRKEEWFWFKSMVTSDVNYPA